MQTLQTKKETTASSNPTSDFASQLDVSSKIKDKLGLALVKQGLVRLEIVEEALKRKDKINASVADRRANRGLANILVDDFNVNHDVVFSQVASIYGFREINLDVKDLSDDRINFCKKKLDSLPVSTRDYIIKHQILPFRYDYDRPGKMIFVAPDPTDRMILVIARAMKLQTYEVCYVRLDSMKPIFDKIYPPENQFLKELETSDLGLMDEAAEEEEFDEAEIEAEINKSMLVNLAEGMLVEAVRLGASDVHIIPRTSNSTDIMFRIDGMLRTWHSLEGVRPEAMAAVMKDRAKNVDRFERDRAQDGFIQRKVDGHMIRFRFSSIPLVGQEYQYKFESIVIRILDDRSVITDLDKLGFHGLAREAFKKAINQPQGLVIVTGPTGSGKSTTLIAALSHIVRPEINVLTVEDPVEYIIPGVRQLKIGKKMDFELALRAILRHDPDVVMLGEIRDKETGETAIKLANTGHLTFSSLHTNDAPSAISRLFKMGIETFLIAYAINLIVAQRLMRRLCEKCKRPARDLDPVIPKGLGFTDEEIKTITFYESVGCDHCHSSGYKGRTAIHEALYFSKRIRQLIFEAKGDINEDAIREQAVAEGMMTLQVSARQRVKEGISDLKEVARVTTTA